jgi:putative membrane protein
MNAVRDSVVFFDDFLIYFALSLFLLAVFAWIYTKVTPYRELELIRSGNIAAAITLAGAMIGFTLPLASVVSNAVGLMDLLMFAALAGLSQIVVFVLARKLLPGLADSIEDGNIAKATMTAAMAVCVGLLNAAALTY